VEDLEKQIAVLAEELADEREALSRLRITRGHRSGGAGGGRGAAGWRPLRR